jgi:hypothetical protein
VVGDTLTGIKKILALVLILATIAQSAFANSQESTDKVVICGISLGMKAYEVFDILGKPSSKTGDMASKKGGKSIFEFGVKDSQKVDFTLSIFTEDNRVNLIILKRIIKPYMSLDKVSNAFPKSNVPITFDKADLDRQLGAPVAQTTSAFFYRNGVGYIKEDNREFLAISVDSILRADYQEFRKSRPDYGLEVSESRFTYTVSKLRKDVFRSCEVTGFLKNYREEPVNVRVRVILREPKSREFIHAFEDIVENVKPGDKTLFTISSIEEILVPNSKATFLIELSVVK